ncbi:MAG: isoamylase early set domain-containing protein [Deltaproteobacteria bacterium]|nr:isoamylase early set domain-containing protein [Deltaproteobacteria bacterium]
MVETNKRVVQFALAEPTAKSVVLVGDFNLWSKDATPLQKNADGVWEVRVPLTEGAYTYQFIVDGTHWMPDPKADAIDDGFGRKNSVVSL